MAVNICVVLLLNTWRRHGNLPYLAIGNTESLEKTFSMTSLAININFLIGQVNILSWGQLEWRHVPRPFFSLQRICSEINIFS